VVARRSRGREQPQVIRPRPAPQGLRGRELARAPVRGGEEQAVGAGAHDRGDVALERARHRLERALDTLRLARDQVAQALGRLGQLGEDRERREHGLEQGHIRGQLPAHLAHRFQLLAEGALIVRLLVDPVPVGVS
jgi:hypothetical protein